MITPSDLGLPSKFTEFRPNQLDIAMKAAASTKYAYLLDAATGTGKSLVAGTVQKLLGTRIVYTCTTKQLQDQILVDFPYARLLKGRNAYPCVRHRRMYPEVTAEDCSNTEARPCNHVNECIYLLEKEAALAAPLAVLNLSYFLHEANHVGQFSGAGFLVIDEFDSVEDQLMSFVEVSITQKQLDEIGLDEPKLVTKYESWLEWSRAALKIMRPRLESVRAELEHSWSTVNFPLIKAEKRLSRLVDKLEFMSREVDSTWVWMKGTDRWAFKPIWVSKYANHNLWRHANRVLGMSATILNPIQMCINVGLKYADITYRAMPSPFPKENRPVLYQPCASVTAKTMDTALPALKKRIQQIIDDHPDDKILCHCVTYKIRDYLMKSMNSGRLMTHDTFNRSEMLAVFKKSKYPKVMISPSMDRGVDLPHDECRIVIIAKCPFPDLGDPQTNKRLYASKDGRRWYAHKTVSKIIQMSGRGVRSSTDYATTYILDEQFKRIYDDNKDMFPTWYRDAVVL